ncbi:hypothetical protein I553_10761 [Mycobacterium xenopi 4042]|uniref:Uncharacterized protein n=1 Tax=Mycobacterium xenopi 4042 TaxID=1299334 RepID=X8DAS3_MYCXE|nr:hypothetical protein I552_0523 [Mycobacterium xenopi 3993]EUA65464.1 hypothetical protein I553_10761 [Mycobacterium xenopi 4042]
MRMPGSTSHTPSCATPLNHRRSDPTIIGTLALRGPRPANTITNHDRQGASTSL